MSQLITDGPFRGLLRNGYGCILADPPWGFKTFNAVGVPQRAEEQHYPTMTGPEMMSLPVRDVAAKDCALIMWVIGSHLPLALELGAAWGFTFKTDLFTWVKVGKNDPDVRPISLGYWSRKQVEQALLFTRGSPKRLDAGVRQLIEANDHTIYAHKRFHSQKPEEQYGRIESLVDGPYLEMFARKSQPGWHVFGNQTTKFDEINLEDAFT